MNTWFGSRISDKGTKPTTSHDQAVKRQGPEPLPLLFGRERRLTSKHAHRLGPPTLQSWHWPWKTADSRLKAAHLLKKRSQIRKGEVRPWAEIQRFVISLLLQTFTPTLASQAWNRIQPKGLYRLSVTSIVEKRIGKTSTKENTDSCYC